MVRNLPAQTLITGGKIWPGLLHGQTVLYDLPDCGKFVAGEFLGFTNCGDHSQHVRFKPQGSLWFIHIVS